MSQDSYERLADALDALPNGFPRMPSGVEIRLLKKAFTEEEVEVAGYMNRAYETASEIADRAGLTEDRVKEVLVDLEPRRLVRQAADGTEKYRLGPFVVGWYESLMEGVMRTDLEFVKLFEQYLKEGGGERIMAPRPGVLGVVPVRGSLKQSLLQPYHDIDAHFARHERFAVIDCVCRIERNLIGSDCSTPVKRCGFVGVPPQTPLSEGVLDREQALKLFSQLEDEGHVHLGFYGFTSTAESPQFVGSCNCCGDCCGILRSVNEFGISEGPQKSNYRVVIDLDSCASCGTCIERCQVHAIAGDENDMPVLNRDRCIGCGLCVTTCSGEAIELEPVSEEEWFDIPFSFEEWEEMRLNNLLK
jgi:NAD-dependent dihydropyrimidine dehydrogenase PreA subunit